MKGKGEKTMRGNLKNKFLKRVVAMILSVLMVFGIVPNSVMTVSAATETHEDVVTVTVTDQSGSKLEGATVAYVINSRTQGDNYRSGSVVTDTEGVADIISSEEYSSDDMTVSIKVSKNGYKDNNSYTSVALTDARQNITITLEEKLDMGITVIPTNVEYDGNEHEAATVSGKKAGDKVSYKLGDGSWSETVPKISAVGTYSLEVKVERSGFEDFTQTVTPQIKKGKFSVPVTFYSGKYDGKEHPVISISDSDKKEGDKIYVRLNNQEQWSDVIPSISATGTNKVEVKVHRDDNYEDYVVVDSAVITAAEIEGLNVILADNFTYDGVMHEVVKEITGNEDKDQFKYKVKRVNDNSWIYGNDDTWYDGKDIPKIKDAGTYEVSIKVSRANHNDKDVVLDPKQIVIEKADFVLVRRDTNIASEVNYGENNNEYNFSVNCADPTTITYAVENNSLEDAGEDISNIAEIDANGKLTVKKGGYNIKVKATAAGDDNHNETTAEYELTIVKTDNLLSFSNKKITYTVGTENGIVAKQQAVKDSGDNGKVSYSASVSQEKDKSLEDVGLKLSEKGVLKVEDYEKLADALKNSSQELKIEITADKAVGTKTVKRSNEKKDVYKEADASYEVTIVYAETPESAYKLYDPDDNEIEKKNGKYKGNGDDGWFKTAVTVKPADESYKIAKEISGAYSEKVVFNDQGKPNQGRWIYLKNSETGAICAPIQVTEIEKIDSVAPDANNITIEYKSGENIFAKIINYFKDDVTITFTAYDATSGIKSFNWTYTRADGASTSNTETKQGTVEAVKVDEDEQDKTEEGLTKYTGTVTLSKRESLNGNITVNAVDCAGLKSADKTDDERIIVVDSFAPTRNVYYELEDDGTSQIVDKHQYYSDNVKVTFSIKEINFDGSSVNVAVRKDGSVEEKVENLDWQLVTDSQEPDTYRAEMVLEEEGDYIITMNLEDPAGNEMNPYTSDTITIDKTKPIINLKAANSNDQTVAIEITEKNFRANDIEIDVTAVDLNNTNITITDFQQYLRDESNWIHDGVSHKIELSKDNILVDAIYTMKVKYKDLALIEADMADSGEFKVDHVKPSLADMKVTYSEPILEKIMEIGTYGFYKANVTVTFEAKDAISGIDKFTWSYLREDGASESNVEKYIDKEIIDITQDDDDNSIFYGSVTLPLEKADQLRGRIEFTATDEYNNESDALLDSGNIIVRDTIAPKMMEAFFEPSNIDSDKMYYNKDVIATFSVKEINFYSEDVELQISKDGGVFNRVSPDDIEWMQITENDSKDTYRGTFTMKVPDDHSADGTYVFRVEYPDRSGNEMQQYNSIPIIVDTKSPIIDVKYANTDVKNALSDSEDHTRQYFDKTQTAKVTIIEDHFCGADYTFVAKDVTGKVLDTNQLVKKTNWTTKGNQHTMTITYPGDANYTFDVECTDLATNVSADYPEDYFTVDKTAPTDLTVSYSQSVLDKILSDITFGFYNAKMTVEISASDDVSKVHSFDYSYLKAAGVSDVNAELVAQKIEENGITYSNEGKTATTKFDIPKAALGNNNQFNGTVRFTANDRSENRSEELAGTKRIVVDNIAPTSSMEYSAPVQVVNGISYYVDAVNATLTIVEANFYAEDVQVSVTKDGNTYSVTPSWSSRNTDVHTGTFTLSEDGDYFITVNYTDKSSNKMITYTSDQLTVDSEILAPVITVNGEEANGKAFKDEVVPAVSFEDKNFESYKITLTRTRYDAKNVDVTDEFIGTRISVNDQGGSGTFDTFVKEPEVDGIYTMTVSIQDKALNTIETTATFTVNRYGSVYVYDNYLVSLIKNGGAYIQDVENDLKITEYNPDKLVAGTLNVEISKDGKPLEDVVYTTTPEVNEYASIGSSGWYQYTHTIDKSNFAADGVYKVAISSKDATGNSIETTNYEDLEILFRVDSTAPEISSIVGLEESIINAQSVTIRYNVYDTIGLGSIEAYVDDEIVETVTDFSKDQNNYEGSFEVSENSSAQNIRLVVKDLAGNVTDTQTDEFKEACVYTFNDSVIITTNAFVRMVAWVKAHAAVVITSVVVIAGAAAFAVVVLRKRRKDGNSNK